MCYAGKNVVGLIVENQRVQLTSEADIQMANTRTKAAQKDLANLETVVLLFHVN